MEEQEQERDLGSLVGEPVGVAFSIAFEQSVGLDLAQIVAELVEAVTVCRRGGRR